MNRSIYLIVIGIVAGLICCYHECVFFEDMLLPKFSLQDEEVQMPVPDIANRESITFILGEDKESDNRYYEEAKNYYTLNEEGKTTHVVTTCRSLTEVREYLTANAPSNGLPWGLINLVSHGNQWTGLSVKVAPDSKRSTVERLKEYINNNEFCALSKTIIDNQTELFLHGCGVGNNEELVKSIATIFAGEQRKPAVHASKLFEYYASVTENNTTQTEHYLSDSWFISYPMDKRPTDNQVSNELHDKYPTASINWHDAVDSSKPRWVGDEYHYTFDVPVKWIIPDSDSIALLETTDTLQWLRQNTTIEKELAGIDIPAEKFSWSFTKVYFNNDDGTKSPAIWIKGYCTMLCVLRALTLGYDRQLALQKPYVPALNDNSYYYSTNSELVSYNLK